MLGTSLAFIDFNCFTSQVCCSLHVKLLRLFKPGLYEPDHIYSESHKLQLTRSPVLFFFLPIPFRFTELCEKPACISRTDSFTFSHASYI